MTKRHRLTRLLCGKKLADLGLEEFRGVGGGVVLVLGVSQNRNPSMSSNPTGLLLVSLYMPTKGGSIIVRNSRSPPDRLVKGKHSHFPTVITPRNSPNNMSPVRCREYHCSVTHWSRLTESLSAGLRLHPRPHRPCASSGSCGHEKGGGQSCDLSVGSPPRSRGKSSEHFLPSNTGRHLLNQINQKGHLWNLS